MSKLKKLGPYGKQLLEREIQIHQKASNSGIPYFVKLIDSFYENQDLFLVMERCDYDLQKLYRESLKIEVSLELVFQIAIGLLYLHTMGIIHRDIKPANILMKDFSVKIGDFGFSTQSIEPSTNLGSLPFQAPEIHYSKKYDNKVDVWALNTILYKFLTKKYYFDPSNKDTFLEDLKSKPFLPELKSPIPKDVWDLIEKGYKKDPKERLSVLEYIKHPAFDGFRGRYKFLVELSQSVEPLGHDDKQGKCIQQIQAFIQNIQLYMKGHEALKREEQQELRFLLAKKSL